MDFEQARFNMVEQQIRTWDVLDQDVLDLLFKVRREDFVPPAYRSLAFADLEIPLGDGERMWTPKMEARVLQELELKARRSRARDRHRQRLSHGVAGAAAPRGHERRDHARDSRPRPRQACPGGHRQRQDAGRRRRARLGQRAVRRDRAHRLDADAAEACSSSSSRAAAYSRSSATPRP